MAGSVLQSERFEQLRLEATLLLKQRADTTSREPSDILDLIHNLRVYETELEIQNEELRRAQEELTALKREYEDLYELAPCGYLTLNPKGVITRINLTGVALIGVDRTKAQQASMSQFIVEDYHDAFYAARKEAGLSGKTQRLEMPLKTVSGDPLWVRSDIDAEHGTTGHVTQWRIVLTDISERIRIEGQSQRLTDQLEQAKKMQALGTLAGGIAHEFNNMLAIIFGNVELAESALPKADPSKAYLHEALAASKRARDVIRQLLTFTRSKKQTRAPLRMGPVVEKSLKLFHAALPANIEMVTEFQDDLYPVMADATQIHQVVINFCSNAADAMQGGNGVLTIGLENARLTEADTRQHPNLNPGRHVKLTVSDTGVGMDEKTRLQIFEPFFTTKEVGQGTGMGLSVVHGIVASHGGAVGLTSRPGRGTTVTLFLPETLEPVVETQVPVSAPLGGNERILFIDDEVALTKISRQRLEYLGYGVETFTHPFEALKRFEAAPDEFDLVITDLAMPQMTGRQLSVNIRHIREDIPIILCTGHNAQCQTFDQQDSGIRACLSKPYRLDMLANTIRTVLTGQKTGA